MKKEDEIIKLKQKINNLEEQIETLKKQRARDSETLCRYQRFGRISQI